MNHTSKIEDLFARLVDLLMLNLLFVLTSIPIVTIGPSLCALYSVCLKMVRGEDSYLVRSYFHAFRQNFRQAFPISLILGLGITLCLADLWISFTHAGLFFLILGTLAGIGLLVLFVISLYFFPILARFQFTTPQVFANMTHMIATRPATLFSLLALSAPFVFFLFYSLYTAAAVGIFLLIIGFAALSYVHSILLRSLFAAYERS